MSIIPRVAVLVALFFFGLVAPLCAQSDIQSPSPSTSSAKENQPAKKCETLRSRIYDSKGLRDVFIAMDLFEYAQCMNDPDILKKFDLKIYKIENEQLCFANDFLPSNEQKQKIKEVCGDDAKCTVQLFVHKDKKLISDCVTEKAYSGALGFGPFLLRVGHKGHWEMTSQAVNKANYKISPDGERIMCDASQDPDFYEFDDIQAHAQTKESVSGKITDQTIAKLDFYKWGHDRIKIATERCKDGQTRLALYWLGSTLHTIQDLFFHEGITNEEHAYLSGPDFNHDFDFENFDTRFNFGAESSTELLNFVLGEWERNNLQCSLEIRSLKGPMLSPVEKSGLYKKSFAYNIGKMIDYKKNGGSKIQKYLNTRRSIDNPNDYFLSKIMSTFKTFKVELKEKRWLGGLPDKTKAKPMLDNFLNINIKDVTSAQEEMPLHTIFSDLVGYSTRQNGVFSTKSDIYEIHRFVQRDKEYFKGQYMTNIARLKCSYSDYPSSLNNGIRHYGDDAKECVTLLSDVFKEYMEGKGYTVKLLSDRSTERWKVIFFEANKNEVALKYLYQSETIVDSSGKISDSYSSVTTYE
ncbi:hypothetical protein M1B72_07110 [Geomonas paludis]|uniref:Phospholipase C/D domain-containing protein n=1 Tax=Geomonas paludis TaxID=2740185 RepID=A0ABY4LHX2_9BACT|nr:hypothetical protein [Geomonas paludis]UPU37467.1 hypothetical protein M1B72_07110 [Geomonas paludis]